MASGNHDRLVRGDGGNGGPAHAQLVVLSGGLEGRVFRLRASQTVGRAEADIMLPDDEVSRRHATIDWVDGQGYVLRDANSANGTRINGHAVSSSALRKGDEIEVGSVLMRVDEYDPVQDQLAHRQRLELIGRLSAGIAHDLNNSLCAAQTNLDLLREHEAIQRVQHREVSEIFEELAAALRQAADFAPRLLQFARRDKQPAERLNVSTICGDVLGLVSRTFSRSIRVVDDVADGLEIRGEETAFQQIVMTLCLHGRDNMPHGGELRVAARRLSPPQLDDKPLRSAGAHVVLTVSDTGPSLDEYTRDRIFQPTFVRRDGIQGHALGLATTRDLVLALDGYIEVDAPAEGGTRFRVYLPAAKRARITGRGVLSHPSEPVAPVPAPAPKLAVLLVDDDAPVRRALARLLRHDGHDVIEAGDGQQAIGAFRSAARPIDVVLLDVDMPVMDGERAQQALRELNPTLPVLVLTGHANDERTHRMMAAGAVGFLHKPVDRNDLLSRLTRLAQQRQAVAPWSKPTRKHRRGN